MKKDMNSLFAEKVKDFRLPRYKELPDMGLYLEQVVRYINGVVVPLGCPEITSSMALSREETLLTEKMFAILQLRFKTIRQSKSSNKSGKKIKITAIAP